jgi:hypothetical protein
MADDRSIPTSAEILLLSDSDTLTGLVKIALRNQWAMREHRIGVSELQLPAVDDQVKLIILALSQESSEPVVVMARTNTIRLVGKVPLIIISVATQRFEHWPDDRIWCIDFPLDWERLSQTVKEIMRENQRASNRQGLPRASVRSGGG